MQVELVETRAAAQILRRDLALIVLQFAVLDESLETGEIETGRILNQRIRRRRSNIGHIHEVTVVGPGHAKHGRTVCRDIGEGIAEALARTAVVEEFDTGLVVAKEGMFVTDFQAIGIIDLIVCSAVAGVVGIDTCSGVGVVRECHRRGTRADILGTLPSVRTTDADAIVPTLVELADDVPAIALVGVGQQHVGVGAGSGVEGLITDTTIWGERRAGSRIGDGAQVDPGQRILDTRPLHVEPEIPVIAQRAKIGGVIGRARHLPLRRDLEIGIEFIGRGNRRAGAGDQRIERSRDAGTAGDAVERCRTDRVGGGGIDRHAVDGEGAIGITVDLDTTQRRAGIRIIVRNPNVRVAASIKAGCGAQLQAVTSLPVSREARLENLAAVERRGIGKAGARQEVGVERRLNWGFIQVPAEPGRHGQGIGNVPNILQTKGIVVGREQRADRVDAALQRIGIIELVGPLCLQISDRIEVEGARNALGEKIVEILTTAFGDELDRVVIHFQLRLEFDPKRLGRKFIGLARYVRAELDTAGAGLADQRRRRRAGSRFEADLELAKFGAVVRHLETDIIIVVDAQLGRETVAPLVVQLEDTIMIDRPLIVIIRLQCQGRVGGVGLAGQLAGENIALVVNIGERGAVTVGDVPVDLCNDLVVIFADVVGHTQWVIFVDRVRDRSDLVDLGLGDGGRRHVDNCRGLVAQAFPGDSKEQLVLDDRASELDTKVLRFEIAVERLAARRVAGKGIRGVGEEGRTVELIGARLQLRIDGAALKTTLLDVGRNRFDREFADGIKRHRAARRGETTRFKAERVAELDAVDTDAVETVVLAGDRDGATVGWIKCDERIARREVADVAVDGRNTGNVLGRQHRGRTG